MKRRPIGRIACLVPLLLLTCLMPAVAGGTQEKSAAGPTGPVKITMWYSVGGNPRKATEVLVERFNQNQNKYILEAVYSGGYEDTTQKLLAAAVAGGLPAIAHMAHAYAPQMVKAGYIEPLDDFIARDPEIEKKDFVPALYEANVWEGKAYGVPYNCSNPVYYYNKDLYRRAGLDPEKSPETWNDMAQYAAKIAKIDAETTGFNIERGSGWISQGYVWQFGGEWIKPDNSAVLWDSPQSVEALTFMQKMVKDGIATYMGGDKLDASGRSGGVFRSTASLTSILDRFEYEVGVGIQPYKTRKMVPLGGGSLYMVKGLSPREQEAAWAFMKFATTPVSQMFWAKATGYQVSSQKAVESTEMRQLWESEPRARITYDQLPYSRAEDDTWLAPFLEVRDIFNDAWDRTILTGLDPKATLAEAKAKADKILKE